ncbi:MAG: TetR family transcriptional regulator [Actinobacteria bacterium]|nr:TetR family transcriptional regulator [Actinomycetota bacterium]
MGRSNETTDVILDAAARLFRAHGLGGTSIRAIADLAGVLPGSLTYRYPTKESLVLALMDRTVTRMLADIRLAISKSEDPLERIHLALRAYLSGLLEGDDSVYVLLFEFPRMSEESRAELIRKRRAYESLWDGLLFAAVGSGQLSQQLDLRLLRRHLIGAVNSVAFWYRPGGGRTPAEIADSYYAFFLVGAMSDSVRPPDVDVLRARLGAGDPTLQLDTGDPTTDPAWANR